MNYDTNENVRELLDRVQIDLAAYNFHHQNYAGISLVVNDRDYL